MFRFSSLLILLLAISGRVYGEVNSWTKPTSGNWEEPFWSAGSLPSLTSDAMFTNAGWKALALGPSTRAFPSSLNIHSLTVSSPTGTVNTLLLNFLGILTPLKAVDIYLGTNANILSLNSRMEISSSLVVDGAFSFGQYSELVTPRLEVGRLGPGEFYMTNGTISVNYQFWIGTSNDATCVQYGGTNSSADLQLLTHNTSYRLVDGAIEAGNIAVGNAKGISAEAMFVQDSGRVTLSSGLLIGYSDAHGTYLMNNGILSADIEVVGQAPGQFSDSLGTFVQANGTNSTRALMLGWSLRGGYYTLSNGVLHSGTTVIAPRNSAFKQYGGTHIATNGVTVQGDDASGNRVFYSVYELHGGQLITSQLSIRKSNFGQDGGTNRVSGTVSLEEGFFASGYDMSGGFFSCSNLTIRAGHGTGHFGQSGGTSEVANLLEIGPGIGGCCDGKAAYTLGGGSAKVKDIVLNAEAFLRLIGGSLLSTGSMTFAGGRLEMGVPQQQFGPVTLLATSTIFFATSPAVLRFADSHTTVFGSSAALIVTNWNGSANGGGSHQLVFGVNAQGLSAAQLGKTLFRNPGGFAPGDYAATILPTGEVVPLASTGGPSILLSKGSNSFTLSWSGPFLLQTATNVVGPYEDLTNAVSPHQVQLDRQPQRYFRLRQ
jgi:hypothetical protein